MALGYVTTPKDYWIASNALYISRNADGDPDYIIGNTTAGAQILCYVKGVNGLDYDAGHNYRRWPLSLSPTFFNTETEKYVYVAIPRPGNPVGQAVVIFPSEKLDIYGKNEAGVQVCPADYYYIWLQGILSATNAGHTLEREWTQQIDTGTLSSDEALSATETDWYRYSTVDEIVTFLKEIVMSPKSWFKNLRLGSSSANLTGVATASTSDDYAESEELVVTPSYLGNKYLSKTHDDTAQGEIGFLKGLWVKTKGLFGIDADGNAKVNNLSASGGATILGNAMVGGDVLIKGAETVNLVRSDNYTGDGIADTGFRLTADDGTGSSKLTVDNLYIRKKATFEELEVKKETAVAGNEIRSCAANIINRTDYLDENNNLLGYSYTKVPWLLNGVPFLLNGIFFGRQRQTRMMMSDTDVAKISVIRCYFLAKDGEREVDNMWKADNENGHDLVRCQTMNLVNSKRQTFISSVSESKAGNVFWWRKAVRVSSSPVTLDDGKEYHWIDVSMKDCAQGSDIPAAGDHIVQFGNDTNPERMNLIAQEINGGDAPSIKAYSGIYTYNLEKCWWGGSPRKMMLSPRKGYEFYGPSFKFVQEYGIEPAAMERGAWTDITPEADDATGNMVRKCYYYDKVSHQGCYWLCIFSGGAHWVAEETFTYNNVTYTKGRTIADDKYSALDTAHKELCTRKEDYTTDEPSTASLSWKKIVDRGTSVKSVVTAYAKQDPKDYNGTAPANGWESTIAALGTIDEGWYVWTRSITTYSDTLDDTTTYSVTRWGIDGDGIDDIETKFYESASMLSQNQLKALTESDWKEYNELPLNQGDYIYTRTKITYDKGGPSTVSYSVNRIGQDGVSYLTTEEYYCLGDSRTTPPSGHPYTRNDGKPQKIEASALKITGAWSESRPTYDTSSAAGRAKKYLWNFEVGYDTTTIVQVTQPMCIANYEKGIASIIETYAISAYSVAPQAGGYPSDITSWTDEAHDCAPTDEKPYQWNKTVTTYSDGSSDTFYHVSGVKGTHGTNITKSGVDTYRYAVSSQGTDSSKVTGWSTSKPSSWAQNEFLWTETTMHWSDGSTTVLYSSERNPNDGKPGQDVVTGTTTITYCVSDTNQQPADSQFKPYAQIVSQIQQGKWLWSKATTPYYKGSVSEANYLNSSSNYNVSYIATNGKSVTYDAANSSISYAISSYGVAGSGRDYPSDITAWSNTVPEPQNGKYLWTRDITAYNDGGTIKTTTSYGVSYYGKDGDSVEIDTTRTFVRYSSQKTEARPADNTFTLTEPPALGQGDYLWILSQTAYVGVADPLKSYSVSRVGTDGDKGDPGADGYTTHFAYATLQPGQTLPANGKVTQQNYQTYFGSTFSTTNFSGATVIGTYRQKNEKDGSTDADSQNAWEYTWTQWKGDGITIDSGNTFIRYAKAATQPALNKDDTNVWKTAISALSPSAGDTIWTWVHTAYSDGNYTDVCNPSYYGTNGNTPTITNGYWYINGSNTGVKAEGSDGDTPYIGSNGNWWIGTTDTKVQAEAQSALHCDLSNMMDGVAMTSEGKVTAQQQIATTLAIYYGMDVQTLTNLTWSALPTGITASRSGGTVTFTIDKDTQLTNDKAEITLTGTTAKGSMSALFTIQGFRAGGNGTSPVIFQLLPSENEIKKSKTGTYTPATLTCSVTKRDGNNAPVAYTGSEVTIKMSVDNGTEQGYAAITTNNTKPNIGVTYKLYQGTTLIDVETVPVVVDGENGVGSRIVTLPVKYMNTGNTETSGNQPTEAYSNSKWKDSIAATNPSVGDYIWSIYGVTPYTIDKNGNETVGTTVYSYGVNRVGTDGNSAYSMHTAYAETAPNAPSGTGVTGFSTTMTPNSKFIGICVRQQQSGTGMDDDPTDPTAYEWAKFEGPQGANGRAMTGSSEHYKASSLATGETKPSSDAQEWTTNPNVPDGSGNTQWNESKKYLWNYERIEYTESDGTVTVERTAPHVIAIWTKDGAEGRGIDSIVNYYAINNDPDNAPTTGWEDDPMAPTTDSPYLWNYERICWTKGTPAYTDTAPHVIGSKGEKMTFDDLTQAEKDSLKGADGYTVTCEPASLVINQNDGGSYDISSASPAYFKPRVTKGSGTTNLVTAVSVSRNYCVKDGSVNIVNTDPWTSANGLPVTGVYSTAITNKYTQGYLVLSVTADGKAFSITIPIAVNYLGTYIETIVDGKKTTIAQETKTMIEQDNFVVKTATYNEEKSAWQDAASWVSSVNTPAATVANYNQRITNAEENISTVTRKVDNISNANLLTGLADGEGWTHDESSFNAGKVEFHPAYISRQGSVPYQLISADVVLPAGRYTLSAESWSGGSQLLFIIQEFNNDEEDPDYDDYSDVTVDAGEQPVLTFNISREKRMRMMCLSMESTFTVTKPKLECGEVATAYSTEGDVTQSRIRQTADEIELKVNNTGINVNDGTIDLAAEKVTFSYEENGEKKSDKIWIDPATGTLRAVDGVFTGSLLYHKVIRYVTTTPNMDTEELFTYQSVPDAEQGRSVLSSFSLKCDICIISGKAISSYESRSTDHQWFGFELWLPPASMFPGASMRIINGTYGENSTKWYGSPSVITLRVFHNQDTEEAHEDGDFVTDEFGKQMAILKNAFAVAAPFKYWRLVNNTEIENNLYRYYTKLVFKNYDSIELVSTENPYLQQGSGEYVWLVIDTKEHELNNEEI